MRWLLLFALAAFLGTKDIATSFSDFSVSYFAAQELLRGTGSIYRSYEGYPEAFGYPHAALLPLLPLVATLPRTAVQVAFGLSQGLATVLLVKELLRIFAPVTLSRALLALLLLGRPLANALHNGQPALWCGVLATLGVRLLLEKRDAASGLALAGATTLKLTPGLFLVALPLLPRFRAAAALGSALVALCVLLPWPFLGTARHFGTLADFADAMLAPLLDPSRGAAILWGARGLHVGGAFGTDVPRAVRWAWSAVLLALAMVAWVRAGRAPERERLLARCGITLLVMCLLAPLTRAHHLLIASVPLLAFCLAEARGVAARSAWWIGVLCLVFAFPLRQRAWLPVSVWREIEYPLGHLGLVAVLLWHATDNWGRTPIIQPCPNASPSSPACST